MVDLWCLRTNINLFWLLGGGGAPVVVLLLLLLLLVVVAISSLLILNVYIHQYSPMLNTCQGKISKAKLKQLRLILLKHLLIFIIVNWVIFKTFTSVINLDLFWTRVLSLYMSMVFSSLTLMIPTVGVSKLVSIKLSPGAKGMTKHWHLLQTYMLTSTLSLSLSTANNI